MAQNSQNRPESAAKAPDPSHNYERSHPDRESPSGSTQQTYPRPHDHPDRVGPESTSRHTNRPNADSLENDPRRGPITDPAKVDHSMHEEEPLGWDQSPQGSANPREQRQPRTEGKGGVD
jgi:hypothetical protein